MFTDPIRRCRNEGGHDLTWCSNSNKFDNNQKLDVICKDFKPKYRVCHLSAINDDTKNARFEFTKYRHFTSDFAYSACNNIGGSLPSLEEELDAIWLTVYVIGFWGRFDNVTKIGHLDAVEFSNPLVRVARASP